MIVGDDYQRLVRQVESLRQQRDKAEGALQQLLKRLKEEFGCKTLVEAKRKLKELEDEERVGYKAYQEAREEFDKKWKGKLEGLK